MERLVSYIRTNFFYGRSFVSDDDLNAQVVRWLDTVANVRIHGILKERPARRFEAERPRLMPLAPWAYRPVIPRPVEAEPGRAAEGGDPSARGCRAPPVGRVCPDRGRRIVRPPPRRDRIAAQLADLKMPGALEALDEVLRGIDGGGTTAGEAIEPLLAAQIALRNSRRLEAAMRSSWLPCA